MSWSSKKHISWKFICSSHRSFTVHIFQTQEFQMEMTCEGCSNAARRVLGKLGVSESDIQTDLQAQKVTVTSTFSKEKLLETLQKTGKKVSFIGVKN
ncbi:copper transport protein ATOX1-like [Mercenaria mercenaria]|uniref:copper transport protein ATOX1-like n=1 Tax=Mercenaria mercenaria TaxID=6596 RepID=UPI00234F3DFC|nr:copper transport protein ATOX1-like [Mercenaria mercenaria]